MHFNPLSANITKWSNTLKQFVAKLPTNCLNVFDHFVGLALKGLKTKTSLQSGTKCLYEKKTSHQNKIPVEVGSLLGREFIFVETDFDFSIEFCLADAFTLPGCLFSNINTP